MLRIIQKQEEFKKINRKNELYDAFKSKEVLNLFIKNENIEDIEKILIKNNNIIGNIKFDVTTKKNKFSKNSKMLILKNKDYEITLLRIDINEINPNHILTIKIELEDKEENLFKLSKIIIDNNKIIKEYLTKTKDIIYPKLSVINDQIMFEEQYFRVIDETTKKTINIKKFLDSLQEKHTNILKYFTLEKNTILDDKLKEVLNNINNNNESLKLILNKNNLNIKIEEILKAINYRKFKNSELLTFNLKNEVYILKNINEDISVFYLKNTWKAFEPYIKKEDLKININQNGIYIINKSFENQNEINIDKYKFYSDNIEISENYYKMDSSFTQVYISNYSNDSEVYIDEIKDIIEKENNGMISPVMFINELYDLMLKMKAINLEQFIKNDFTITNESLDLILLTHDIDIRNIKGFDIALYRSQYNIKNGIKYEIK